MIPYIKSINKKVWKVVETKIEIEDPENLTTAEEVLLQNNDIALSAIHDAIDERIFEQIKNIERAHETWQKLEELFEGTQAMKGAKAYILKEKFASFKMKDECRCFVQAPASKFIVMRVRPGWCAKGHKVYTGLG